jgi:hypothetical protein
MSLEELEHRVEARLREAISLAKRIDASVGAFEPIHEGIVREYLRVKLIAEIDKETRGVREEIIGWEDLRRQYPAQCRETRILACYLKGRSKDFLLCRVILRKWTDAEMIQPTNPHLRNVSTEEFVSRLDRLKALIREGKVDDQLSISAREAIWLHVFQAS